MVVLDSGFFSSFDCSHRMAAIFLSSFLLQTVIVLGLAAFVRRPNRHEPAIEMLDQDPSLTRRRLIVWGVWGVIFAIVSAISASLRTVTAVLMDSTAVIETSCVGPFPNTYRLDRTRLNIAFGHDPEWLTKRPLESAHLTLTQSDKPRPIFIHLKGRPSSKELQDLSPEAMADYAQYRSSHGAHQSSPHQLDTTGLGRPGMIPDVGSSTQ